MLGERLFCGSIRKSGTQWKAGQEPNEQKAGEKLGEECQAVKSLVTKLGTVRIKQAIGECYANEFGAGVYTS